MTKFPEVTDISLEKALLSEAFLVGARFVRVQIGGADFRAAHMDLARFYLAAGKAPSFALAELEGMKFMECNLPASVFHSSDGAKVEFSNCVLDGSTFFAATLNQSRFNECSLKHVSFQEAELQGVRFWKCDMQQTSFWKAHLEGADFSESINLTAEQLADARLDKSTILPRGLTHELVQRVISPELRAALEAIEHNHSADSGDTPAPSAES